MKLTNNVLTPILLALWCLPTCAGDQAAAAVIAKPTFIEFQPDGKTCKVRETAIDCDKVILHLRQVLKLPPGSEVRFRAGRNVPALPIIKRTMDEVQKSEYITVVAYITPPKSAK